MVSLASQLSLLVSLWDIPHSTVCFIRQQSPYYLPPRQGAPAEGRGPLHSRFLRRCQA